MIGRGGIRFLLRRLAQALPVLVFATFVVFSLLKLVPGDIAVTLAGENATDERIAEIRTLYGLDRAFLLQYGDWLWKAAHGDLSKSLLSGEPVMTSIARCLPNTLLIVSIALSVALVVGVPLGMLAASRPRSWIDSGVMGFASLGVAVPNFWLAMLLVSLFALQLNWFPATGSSPFLADPVLSLSHALLPGLALAAGGVAEIARQLRGSLMEILSSQSVRTLHAVGMHPARILWQHGLKNVALNMITVVALLANRLLAATVVVEAVFAVPGMGNLIVNGAILRDFPIVQGVVFTMVLIVISLNLLADMLYRVADPRVT